MADAAASGIGATARRREGECVLLCYYRSRRPRRRPPLPTSHRPRTSPSAPLEPPLVTDASTPRSPSPSPARRDRRPPIAARRPCLPCWAPCLLLYVACSVSCKCNRTKSSPLRLCWRVASVDYVLTAMLAWGQHFILHSRVSRVGMCNGPSTVTAVTSVDGSGPYVSVHRARVQNRADFKFFSRALMIAHEGRRWHVADDTL